MKLNNQLRVEKARIIEKLGETEPGSDEYATLIAQLDKLNQVNKGLLGVSNDVIVSSVSSLAGILLVLNYERIGIVTSKAVTFITKPKI